jgi:hypothetical protein
MSENRFDKILLSEILQGLNDADNFVQNQTGLAGSIAGFSVAIKWKPSRSKRIGLDDYGDRKLKRQLRKKKTKLPLAVCRLIA